MGSELLSRALSELKKVPHEFQFCPLTIFGQVHLRNNLMEVEAGEKTQRRGLRINIGDFDEMVCPRCCYRDIVVVIVVVVVVVVVIVVESLCKWCRLFQSAASFIRLLRPIMKIPPTALSLNRTIN